MENMEKQLKFEKIIKYDTKTNETQPILRNEN